MATPQSNQPTRPPVASGTSVTDIVKDFAHLGPVVSTGGDSKGNSADVDISKLAEQPNVEVEQASHGQPVANRQDRQMPSGADHRTIAPESAQAEARQIVSQARTRHETPRDTLDTTVAEPVVHETVKVRNDEIQQEVIQKEIHEHHEVTRILPVIEREVLPARHFVLQEDGTEAEVPPPAPLGPPGAAR